MRFIYLLAFTLVTGCANTPEVRSLALESRERARLYVSETRTFTERQDQLRALAHARLQMVDATAEEFRQNADTRRQAWRIDGDTRAEALFVAASARSAEQIRAAMLPAAAAPPPALASAPDLTKAMSNLADIAAPPSDQESAEHVFAFLRAVVRETEVLREAADAAAQSAGKEPPKPSP